MMNIIGKINEKSGALKTKNALVMNKINHELENLIKIAEKIIQMCLSERSMLMDEYSSLEKLCQTLESSTDFNSTSHTNQMKKQVSKKSLKNLFSELDQETKPQINTKSGGNYAVCIPDTCFDEVFNAAPAKKIPNPVIIRDTMENIIEEEEEFLAQTNKKLKLPENLVQKQLQTPNSVKKVLNDHGLLDLTTTSTITTLPSAINSPLLLPIKQEALIRSETIENVLNYSDEFRPKSKQAPRKLTQTKLEIHSTPKKATLQNTNHTSNLLLTPNGTKKLRQLTMNQAFDNAKKNNSRLNESSFQLVEDTPEKKTCFGEQRNKGNKLTNDPNASLNAADQHDETVIIPTTIATNELSNQTRQPKRSENDENKSFDEQDDEDLIFKFDQLPKKNKQSPNYKYAQVIRKQDERKKLSTIACKECEQYWNSVPEELRPKQMQDACKHRHKYLPPATPEHYWSIAFPNTQECIERGYGGIVVEDNNNGATRARRKRPLRLLNQQSNDENDDN